MSARQPARGTILRGASALLCAQLLVGIVTVGCDRTARAPANDTARPAGSPRDDSGTAEARNTGWDDRDGPVLLVPGASPAEAQIVLPYALDAGDARPPAAMETATVIARAGRASRVRVSGIAPHTDPLCVAWPTATLRDSAGSGVPPSWNVGFAGAMVTALTMDSVESMSRGDSTRVAAELARLASALRDDTVASFRGLPFVVREMRRFRPADGVEAVVADIARRLATEANPREERLFMIAERTERGPWRAAFWSRASGAEDAVESGDALAIVRLAHGRVGMLVALETGSAIRFALVQRDGRGWHVQWRSAETDC